jgi:hypothetical protein
MAGSDASGAGASAAGFIKRLAGSDAFGAGASAAGVASGWRFGFPLHDRRARRTLRRSAGHPLDATIGGR